MALSPCFISPESSSQDTSKILHNQHLITFLVQNRSRLIGLILPGVQLVRLRVNKEERSSGWEMFWFPRILIANPTGESRNLSALTSFWAWFMICTINVSMLIISWKMDLRGWEIERKRKILKTRQSKNCGFCICVFNNSFDQSKSMVRLVRVEKMVLSGLVFARKIARMILIPNV